MNSILKSYIPIVKMLAKTYGQDCEVVLHDLSTPKNSVVYTANNTVTGRAIGQSFNHLVADVLLSPAFKDDFTANYYFTTEDGRLIKSSTALIKSGKKVIGALCINMDTSRLTAALQYLTAQLPETPQSLTINDDASPTVLPTEAKHINAVADTIIENTIAQYQVSVMKRSDKLAVVRFLDQKGIFLIKGMTEHVAEKLHISKVTVYSYLDEIHAN